MPSLTRELADMLEPGPVRENGVCIGVYLLRPGFTGFAGHFPGFPILPAFVQMRMAQHLIETVLGRPMRLTAVPVAKFTAPLAPGDRVEARCEPGTQPDTWRCRLRGRGGQAEEAATFQLTLVPV